MRTYSAKVSALGFDKEKQAQLIEAAVASPRVSRATARSEAPRGPKKIVQTCVVAAQPLPVAPVEQRARHDVPSQAPPRSRVMLSKDVHRYIAAVACLQSQIKILQGKVAT